MKPSAAVLKPSKPSRDVIAARLAAKKGQPATVRSTQQEIQDQVWSLNTKNVNTKHRNAKTLS